MLHAINQRKAKLGVFRAAGERIPLEDLVTSTVFGTLAFLRAEDRALLLDRIFRGLGLRGFDPKVDPQIILWRQRELSKAGFRSRLVEPDVEIAAGSRTAIVEVKWGAPLEDLQLSSQWLSVGHRHRRWAQHVLLVIEPRKYARAVAACREALADENIDNWPIAVLSWRSLAEQCRLLSVAEDLEPGARHWALHVHDFLQRENPHRLTGWSALDLRVTGTPGWHVAATHWPKSPPPQVSWRVK